MSNPDLLMGQVLQNNVIFNKISVQGSAGRYLAAKSRGGCEVRGMRCEGSEDGVFITRARQGTRSLSH